MAAARPARYRPLFTTVGSGAVADGVALLRMRAEALKGHLDGLLLAVLEPGPTHGYALIEALRANSGGRFDLPTGTIYPALRRLEAAGLVESSWSNDPGRPRRTYQLTRKGRDQLRQRRQEWTDFSTAVTTVMTGGAAWNPAT